MRIGQRVLLASVGIYLLLFFGPLAGFDLFRVIGEIANKPSTLLQQLLIGLANGSLLALIALGYTLVYGIIELVNFAHGDVYMLGAFMSLTVIGAFNVDKGSSPAIKATAIVVAFLSAVVFTAGVNALIERVAYRRLRNAPRLAVLISAIGMSFIVQNVGLFWGSLRAFFPIMGVNSAAPKAFPDLIGRIDVFKDILHIDVPIAFNTKDLLVIVMASVLMIGLRLFVQYTKLGKAMRATAENRDAAKIMGIDVDRVISFTFLLGGALAGAAGLLVGLYNNTAVFTMGFTAGLRAFTAAVVGGIGNITGAMLGGMLIGILAAFSDQYFSSRWTNAWVFAVLVMVMVFRPTGLLGESVGQKA
ncbi:MAG: branched-chain amino acid ABC transporter permease [Chloroflexi bacterium]|nr:branched-chain amino acid ABC transporter permease [Chloroflexota bacterium]